MPAVMAKTLVAMLALAGVAASAAPVGSVERAFDADAELRLVMQVEAALARAQAAQGEIPAAAAAEITAKADLSYAPVTEVAAARETTGHRMVALLEVWRLRLSPLAADSLHRGATTVDIYDTVLVLQSLEATDALLADLDAVTVRLEELALRHRDTPMVGRTLGQHALPMTFGKKVAVWIGETTRARDRLCETRGRLRRSAILKGPVGTYAGLGPRAAEIERSFAMELGLDAPYPDDWHGSRDVPAELALQLGLLSRSFGRLGQEVFLLQSTDIGELAETRAAGTVGSSSMPHKVNPDRSEALIHHARTIPRLAEVIQDDVVNFSERDNTLRPNQVLGELLMAAQAMLQDAKRLLDQLRVDAEAMRRNLDRSGGMVRSSAVTEALAPMLGKGAAEDAVRRASERARTDRTSFAAALRADPIIAGALDADAVDRLLDPLADLAGSQRQVDDVVAASRASRAKGCPAR
jgi:adenylosuccinate lyase